MEIPSHVAIIMDGNGRWAQKSGFPRKSGHRKGVNTLKKIVKASKSLGISCLTVYAFSTENWRRPHKEVNFLMKLFQKTLHNEAKSLHENNVKIQIIGRRYELSPALIQEINYIEELTETNDGMILNIAFNYGGRAEIIDAIKNIYRDINNPDIKQINEKDFQKYLYTSRYPEVELLIRTGGEKRLSNFLLWQTAYAEIYFTNKFWPEFTEEDFYTAVKNFQNRERRFGGINKAGEN